MVERGMQKKPPRLNARQKALLLALGALLAIVIALVAGARMGGEAVEANFSQAKLRPSWEHPFGTDWLGRDVLARTLRGLSVSITVGMVASAISAVIAAVVGIAAATGSKALDGLIGWVIDLVMSVPHLVLVLLISFACGRGLKGLLVGIAVTHWTGLARLIRAEVLQLRSEPYIMASRKLGKRYGWILIRHILPHMAPQFLVGLVLMFPHAILHESSVSFLGFGLPPEQPAIGIILSESMKYLSSGMWWLAFFPGLTLVAIVALFDRLGDHLKALIDPYSAQK